MFKYDKKLLVSGCGITFSGQTARTWVNILSLAGADIVDVGGPAVSNQWIINRAFLQLEADPDIRQAVIQLTAIGKLDVEVDDERIKVLVEPDTIRNFTVDNVWPSSASEEHPSKKLWAKWLFSPGLEVEDLFCKLVLLKNFCDTKNIQLFVFQGYPIPWLETQQNYLQDIIIDIDDWLYKAYPESEHYQFHDHTNSVPCLSYQIVLARQIAQKCNIDIENKINKLLDKLPDIII